MIVQHAQFRRTAVSTSQPKAAGRKGDGEHVELFRFLTVVNRRAP